MTLKQLVIGTALGMTLPSVGLAHLDDGGENLRVQRPALVALYDGSNAAQPGADGEACRLGLTETVADALALPDRVRAGRETAAVRRCELQ